MIDFEHVDSEAAERLRDLADRAQGILIAAGIPAFDWQSSSPRGGAAIEVDTGADEAGGVYISWQVSQELADQINRHLLSHQLTHPSIQYSGKIREAMRDAIITVLSASGLLAKASENDMRPLEVSISG